VCGGYAGDMNYAVYEKAFLVILQAYVQRQGIIVASEGNLKATATNVRGLALEVTRVLDEDRKSFADVEAKKPGKVPA
jgi:vancomycin permeability regulator SanA